jgi:hypothetical protein
MVVFLSAYACLSVIEASIPIANIPTVLPPCVHNIFLSQLIM